MSFQPQDSVCDAFRMILVFAANIQGTPSVPGLYQEIKMGTHTHDETTPQHLFYPTPHTCFLCCYLVFISRRPSRAGTDLVRLCQQNFITCFSDSSTWASTPWPNSVTLSFPRNHLQAQVLKPVALRPHSSDSGVLSQPCSLSFHAAHTQVGQTQESLVQKPPFHLMTQVLL